MSADFWPALRRKLYIHRAALGITQREVAERMGTSQSAISELELGTTPSPTVATLTKWAEALGLDLQIDVAKRPPERSPRQLMSWVGENPTQITPSDPS